MTGSGRQVAEPVAAPPRHAHRMPSSPVTRALVGVARGGLTLAFWAGLAGSVAACWFGTPPLSLAAPAPALLSVARVAGMAAGYLLLVQVLLTTRIAVFDRLLGAG